MANIFSVRRSDPPEEQISISDQGTDVLIQILVLAASALAETDSQKRMAVWLAEHDATRGTGSIGFAIADMPWDSASFEADRQFWVRVMDAASQKTGWDTLNFRPNAERLMPMLGWFRKRFFRLRAEDINPDALAGWCDEMDDDDPTLNGFPRCRQHGVYLTWCGCRICGN